MPDGSYPEPELIHNAFQLSMEETKRMKSDQFQSMPVWFELGPNKNPVGANLLTQGGVGRLNVVKVHPTNNMEI